MIAEILSTGDEILTGALIDSNSAYIAGRLVENGMVVVRKSCVGDNPDDITAILKDIGNRSDVVIVTGGLGPTEDDLTSESVAGAAGVKLVFNEDADRSIKEFFRSRNRLKNLSDKKQAMLPEGSECIPNPVGTAPGFSKKVGRCMVFCLPGVPSEMRYMLSEYVLPRILELFKNEQKVFSIKKMSLFGLPESAVGEKLKGLPQLFPGIRLGLRASFPEIQIRLYGSGDSRDDVHEKIENAGLWVMGKVGRWIYSETGKSMAVEIGKLLCERDATLSVAESCTGGLISHMLTSIPGSSDYFLFTGVTYSNQSKIEVLDVSSESLKSYGAVDETVVKEMARGVQRLSGSTYGLSTSGIAGPGGGTDDKPVGTICIGLATPDNVHAHRFELSFGDRARNKTIFAVAALEILRRKLLDIPIEI